MLDISIMNADKVVVDEKSEKKFFESLVSIEEKIDGTKLTLVRNDIPWNKDYTKNWIVAYKGNILYAEEYHGVNIQIAKKKSISVSQYVIIHNHLKTVHKNTKGIELGMEFFVEFAMRKPTLTRNYENKHALILIAWSPTLYHEKFGKLKTFPEGFNTHNRKRYADMLGFDIPSERSIFPLSKSYEKFKKELFNIESTYGGKVEGYVLKMNDGRVLKIIQDDQYDKKVRSDIAATYKMDKESESAYYAMINDMALGIVNWDMKHAELNFRQAISDLSYLVYTMDINIEHEKKSNLNKQDDLFLTAKNIILKRLKGNNWAMFQGRFQPPTKAHIEIIRNALAKYDGVAIVVVKGLKSAADKNPFPFELQKEIFEGMFKDKVIIKQTSSGNIMYTIDNLGQNINAIIAGSDRVEGYRNQLSTTSNIVIDEITRSADDVSATKLRQALKDGDFESFKRLTDPGMHVHYKELRLYT